MFIISHSVSLCIHCLAPAYKSEHAVFDFLSCFTYFKLAIIDFPNTVLEQQKKTLTLCLLAYLMNIPD